MSVLALIIAIVLAAIAWEQIQRKHTAREANRADAARVFLGKSDAKRFEAAEQELRSVVNKHLPTLLIKHNQLVFEDEYGNRVYSRFLKEIDYFIDSTVPQNIKDYFESLYGNHKVHMAIEVEDIVLRAALEQTGSDISYSNDMSGQDFEKLVANLAREAGTEVKLTPSTGDQGVDLLLSVSGIRIAVQCKRSSKPVGNKAVQEAYTGSRFYQADLAWVVSDQSFTRQAKQLSESLSVKLLHFSQLQFAVGELTSDSHWP